MICIFFKVEYLEDLRKVFQMSYIVGKPSFDSKTCVFLVHSY